MSAPLLTLREVGVDYGDVPILRDVAMDVHPAQIVGIVGESGSGKSTAIYATLGILGRGGRVTAGDITYDGKNLLALSAEQMRCLRGDELSLIAKDPRA